MAKKLYEIKDFSGGLNAYADPRDIKDNEFSQNWNILVDKSGILRVVGSAEKDINASHIDNPLFHPGYGFFQFAVDYGFNAVDGAFNFGFEQGTVHAQGTDTDLQFVLEETSSCSSTDDYYKGMTVFFYSATNNNGNSRIVHSYTGSSRTITLTSDCTDAITTSDKYMIFRWKSVDFTTGSAGTEQNFITDGTIGYDTGFRVSGTDGYSFDSDFYAVSKITGGDNTSVSGGYLEYAGEGETNLTLKAGVTYNLSFKCGYKEIWRNIVTQGDSSNNYLGLPPWIELYSATVTNDGSSTDNTLNTGLNLMYDNHWAKRLDSIEGTVQNYISNPTKNCLENGDFRDTSNHWTVVTGSLVTLNTSVTTSSKYGGHEGTAQITTGAVTDLANSGNTSYHAGYVKSDNMALDVGSYYRLNFVYNGEEGVRYAIYDETGDQFLVPWTNNGTKKTSSNGWEYPFQQIDSDKKTTNYIYFYVPEIDSTPTTRNIQLRLNSGKDDSSVYISGISIRKAYNDLVNMGYENVEGNPFLTNVSEFYTYRTTFKIPPEYNDATDWILRVHAGSWDYQDDAFSDSMSTTQEVYIDDIRLSSDDGDVFTLLSSNSQLHSKVLLHSESQGNTWNNLFDYQEPNAEVNFNYANGVLRASDGNFKTNNPNKILYYNKESNESSSWKKGWKVKNDFLLNPPSVTTYSIVPEDEFTATNPESSDISAFNAIPYLNTLYDGIRYKSPGEFESDGEAYIPSIQTDWRLNKFGANSATGIVTRYWWAAETYEAANFTPYECSILSGNDAYIPTEETRALHPADQHHIVAAGFGRTGWDDDSGTRGGFFAHDDGFYSQALWPLKIVIKSDDYESLGSDEDGGELAYGLKSHVESNGFQFDDSNAENYLDKLTVYKIEYDVDFEFQSYKKGNSTGDADDLWATHRPVPWFDVQAGKVGGGIDLTNTYDDVQDFINSKEMPSRTAIKYTNVGLTSHSAGKLLHEVKSGADYLPGNPSIKSSRNFEDASAGYFKACTINFSGEYTWDINDSDLIDVVNGDDLLFTIADHLESGHEKVFANSFRHWGDTGLRCGADLDNPEGANCTFIAKPGGPRGDGTDSSNLPYKQEQIDASNDAEGVGSGDLFAPTNFSNDQEGYGQNGFAVYTRYFINKLRVTFHDHIYRQQLEDSGDDENVFNPALITCGASNSVILFDFEVPDDIAPSGWAERTFVTATSVVNKFGEESGLTIGTDTLPETGSFPPTVCPNISLYLGKEIINNDDISKTKFYMKDSESDVFYLQFYIDHKKGNNGLLYSTTSGESSSGSEYKANSSDAYLYSLNHRFVKDFNEVNSYESETLVSQEDALKTQNLGLKARYKCSVVANNRLYVGNIKQGDEIYGDRMLKSPPGKYGVLPASNFIDVAINDGDEITALSFYKDKLLQFKKHKVFVINTSGDYEFLEDTFHNVGVQGQYSVTVTRHGVVWANEDGCFLYNGKKIENLIQDKIPKSSSYENPAESGNSSNNRWCANSTAGDCVVGYDTNKDTILVNFTKENTAASHPSGATYHFKTKSWSLIFGVWNDSIGRTNTGDMSNMITDKNGEILFYHTSQDASDISQNINTIRKWNHGANNVLSTKNITFTTKDITFGDINVRKKIYKVYITYRVRTNGEDSNLSVTAAINGSQNFNITFSDSSIFAFGDSNSSGTACYSSSTLNETDAIWKTARLVPTTPSQLNNISSLMLKVSGTPSPYNIEINDISISYRIKSVK